MERGVGKTAIVGRPGKSGALVCGVTACAWPTVFFGKANGGTQHRMAITHIRGGSRLVIFEEGEMMKFCSETHEKKKLFDSE